MLSITIPSLFALPLVTIFPASPSTTSSEHIREQRPDDCSSKLRARKETGEVPDVAAGDMLLVVVGQAPVYEWARVPVSLSGRL